MPEKNKVSSLEMDYKYCEDIIRQHSNSFYYAFSQLPKEKAEAVYAVYAFCRRADDCIDTAGSRSEQVRQLKQLHHELVWFSKGTPVDHPIWNALGDVFERFDMELQPFFDQLSGQRMDIDFTMPETMEDVEGYSYYVAGTVGLMLLPILAVDNVRSLKKTAIDLGIAMQITNILRDVGEDLTQNNRIYLPRQEMKRVSYETTDLEQGVINESFIALWETMARRAETLYDGFEQYIDWFDEDSRNQVLLSAGLYRGILDRVRSRQYNCFQ
ncbi:phytoene/squalene synthase family protein [Salibacterium qingdaonense]|uniref:Phytoene synthase n=1 Tax=Salibacterium qingdaonense TaxID=266892 RepID=A0A1I4P4G0_9BACI|nr:phytoene/squalene synthase family protein [Salibacterium qingdaonense]SFM22672.1 phytoene synthase [Salibacterium qingdaonense]